MYETEAVVLVTTGKEAMVPLGVVLENVGFKHSAIDKRGSGGFRSGVAYMMEKD